jgi:hypothetical protein
MDKEEQSERKHKKEDAQILQGSKEQKLGLYNPERKRAIPTRCNEDCSTHQGPREQVTL